MAPAMTSDGIVATTSTALPRHRRGLLLFRRDSGSETNKAMIGAVVGVLIALFLIGCCVFLYYFRDSIRAAQKKRYRRRRKSRGSKSSKGSGGGKGSDGDGGQPPAP